MAALIGLVALIVLPPVLLWNVAGWPLPHSFPTLEELRRGLGPGGLSDELLVGGLALAGWVLWAQVMISVAVEVPAALRYRQARRVPAARPAQALVRKLVAAAALVLGSGLPNTHAVALVRDRPSTESVAEVRAEVQKAFDEARSENADLNLEEIRAEVQKAFEKAQAEHEDADLDLDEVRAEVQKAFEKAKAENPDLRRAEVSSRIDEALAEAKAKTDSALTEARSGADEALDDAQESLDEAREDLDEARTKNSDRDVRIDFDADRDIDINADLDDDLNADFDDVRAQVRRAFNEAEAEHPDVELDGVHSLVQDTLDTVEAIVAQTQPQSSESNLSEARSKVDKALDEATAELRPTSSSSAAPASDSLPTYVVRHGDSLWSIAERYLGNGERYTEIFELNRGVPQDHGILRTPGLIRPGWVLRLPAGAVNVPSSTPRSEPTASPAPTSPEPAMTPPAPSPPTTPSTSSTSTSTTPPPTTTPPTTAPPTPPTTTPSPSTTVLSSAPIAITGLPVATPAPPTTTTSPPPPTTTTPPPPSTTTPADPNLLPSLPVPTASPPGEAMMGAALPVFSGGGSDATEVRPSQGRGEGGTGVFEIMPINLSERRMVGVGLLAAGIVGLLDRLRRAQQRKRLPGRRLLAAEEELVETELAVRVAADHESAELVNLGLRAMAAGIRSAGLEPPEVKAVRVSRNWLEVVLADPLVPAPVGFSSREEGRRWLLPRATDFDHLQATARRLPSPLPALVTVGQSRSAGQVLVDLETGGLTIITGDPDRAREVLYAMAAELANNPWADHLSVVLVGFGEPLAVVPRVHVVDDMDEVIDELEDLAIATDRALAAAGCTSTLEARITEGGRAWVPTVVLCAEPVSDEVARRLATLANQAGRTGVAMVVAGEVVGARWRLDVFAERLSLSSLGAELTPQRLSADELRALGELLDFAQQPASTDDDDSASSEQVRASSEERSELASSSGPDPASWDVLVRVMGAPEIDASLPPKSVELVVYLATHRDAAIGADRLMEALWPRRRPSGPTLNVVVSRARTALGKAADGSLLFPHVGGSRIYRLGPSVHLDYELFAARVTQARGQDPTTAISTLRSALDLVRGRPFEVATGRGYEWAHVEGLISHVEMAVADAAHWLAQLCLDAGDAEGARWATERGLRASPGHEQLYRDLMYAANLDGNRAGVQAVMEELGRVIEEDLVDGDEPYNYLHPETVAVYRELTQSGSSPGLRVRGRGGESGE